MWYEVEQNTRFTFLLDHDSLFSFSFFPGGARTFWYLDRYLWIIFAGDNFNCFLTIFFFDFCFCCFSFFLSLSITFFLVYDMFGNVCGLE